MNDLRTRFLKTYANIPLNLREDVILLFEDADDGIRKPMSWNAAYLEVEQHTDKSDKILNELDSLSLI